MSIDPTEERAEDYASSSSVRPAKRDWRFYLANSWRWQGGPKWTREMDSLEVFFAQSNAVGIPRLCGIALQLAGDAVYEYGAAPLLRRGMRGDHLGLDAKPWSLTWIAGRSSGVLNSLRWTLYRWAVKMARYNR